MGFSQTQITEMGEPYRLVTTPEGTSYKVPEDNEFILWLQTVTGPQTNTEIIAPPMGKNLRIYGFFMSTAGVISVTNKSAAGTHAALGNSGVSSYYTMLGTLVQEGGSICFSATGAGTHAVGVFGWIT